jgi:hypothetical protein
MNDIAPVKRVLLGNAVLGPAARGQINANHMVRSVPRRKPARAWGTTLIRRH